ncbi:MAG TPA: prepilin-type N-terminal cleavage/methylation domain-containing protein [Thermoanaerobaculia bacterium]|nr:prepilin-type N-terminal cleavage/methylation domain-containing protein [Thermoanaerobaculia bacterium]
MRRHSKQIGERGFTLTEILVALAIFTVIFIAALMVYDQSNRVFKLGVEAAETQQNTRVAFDRLVSDLRMTGFDFDRDGIPTGTSVVGTTTFNQYQQSDEQIEFIGRGALTVRANFNYDTDGPPDYGREKAYEPPQFPMVTTSNDEIVTYVMKSADDSKNTQSVSFYADISRPRSVYPDGSAERQMVIPNVDMTNANPPYTLYRATLSTPATTAPTAAVTPVWTPLASNIRSLTFEYYEDPAGTRKLADLNNVVIPPDTYDTAVGGQGQYDPDNPISSIIPRGIRSKIQSIRITLIGMNEARDAKYVDPYETIEAMKPYRKYRLETLVAPRNFNKRGMREQEFKEPGQPTITHISVGWCGNAYLRWEAPAGSAITGGVESYAILYGASSPPENSIDVGLKLESYVYPVLDTPQTNYYFQVKALNSYGSRSSTIVGPINVKNLTTPSVPTNLVATGADPDTTLNNMITLTWKRPLTSASGSPVTAFGTGDPPTGDAAMPISEIKGWVVERSVEAEGVWTSVLTDSSSAPPFLDPFTGILTWTDAKVANCVNYVYRVREVEGASVACGTSTTYNDGGASGNSGFSDEATGSATSEVAPAAPTNLTIADTSECGILPTDNCSIDLSWPQVSQDAAGNAIVVELYELTEYRKLEGESGIGEPVGSPIVVDRDNAAAWGATISYQRIAPKADIGSLTNYVYTYEVRAKQCTAPLSGPSPQRSFPCDIIGIDFDATVSIVIEGSGVANDPWVTTVPADVNISIAGGTVDLIQANLYLGSDVVPIGEATGPISGASFDWPSGLSDHIVYSMEILIEKDGCTRTKTYFVESTSNNCCLVPLAGLDGGVIDATVVQLDAASGQVRIKFENTCGQPLTILNNGIQIKWDPTRLLRSAGGRRMSYVEYPPASGTTRVRHSMSSNSTPVLTSPNQAASPGGKTTIDASSSDYFIVVQFTSDFSENPITHVCVTYSRDTGNEACQIVPRPSAVDDVCD